MTSAVTPAPSWQQAWSARRAEASPLVASRLSAESFERFLAKGFPSTRDEDWKYTSVASIARANFRHDAARVAAPQVGDDVLLSALGGPRIVFVNGRFEPSLSTGGSDAGTLVMPLAAALADGVGAATAHFGTLATARASAFGELNTALFGDGAFVHVQRAAQATDAAVAPIHVVQLTTSGGGEPVATQPRLLIVLEDGAQAALIETHAGEGEGCLSNAVTEIMLGAGAILDHVHVQRQPDSAYHVAATVARLGRDATFRSSVFSLGALLSRHDLSIELRGEGASCEMDGLWFLSGSQHCDHHTLVDHAVPHTTSQQLYKGVHSGRSQGVFNGKVIVRAHAQKTVAHQQNRNLLLSRDALVDTKPELQIHADDVRCTHGATIGQINDDQLFYLRARAIDEDHARRMLTGAFAAEIVNRVKAPALREELTRQLALRHSSLEIEEQA